MSLPPGSKPPCRGAGALLRTGTLLVIPISLLSVARDARLNTQMWPNGTVYRSVEVTIAEGTDRNGAAQLFADHFGERPHAEGDGSRLRAQWRIRPVGEGPEPVLERIGRSLLDMRATYRFSEAFEPSLIGPTEREKRRLEQTTFTYELRMPGRIMETNPHTPFVEGGTARWMLKAADLYPQTPGAKPFTVTATSSQFKCGNATVMLYLALWAIGWVATTVYRRARARPKRI